VQRGSAIVTVKDEHRQRSDDLEGTYLKKGGGLTPREDTRMRGEFALKKDGEKEVQKSVNRAGSQEKSSRAPPTIQ